MLKQHFHFVYVKKNFCFYLSFIYPLKMNMYVCILYMFNFK